jgi:hypothetical protein
VRAAGTSVGHLVQIVCCIVLSDVEAVLCTLSLHLPVMYAAFLLYIPPSLCYHRETTTYREVPSTVSTDGAHEAQIDQTVPRTLRSFPANCHILLVKVSAAAGAVLVLAGTAVCSCTCSVCTHTQHLPSQRDDTCRQQQQY